MLEDSSDESGVEDAHQLTINENYAKAFAYKKEREELSKLKDKYGSDAELDDEQEDEGDSESDESEDEDGEELTPAVDAAILRTLARIKRRDPGIYESGKDIFEEEEKKTSKSTPFGKRPKEEKSKPLTIKQQNISSILHPSRSPTPPPIPTHAQEQAALRSETISAFHKSIPSPSLQVSDSDSDSDGDDLLVLRNKTKDEAEREEDEYRKYLEGAVGDDVGVVLGGLDVGGGREVNEVDAGKEKEKRKKGKRKEKGEEKEGRKEADDQEFLVNYILNRGWIDKSKRHLPTYTEVTAPARPSKKKQKDSEANEEDEQEEEGFFKDEDEEDEFEEVAENFEAFYNFRFEEPNATTIPRAPRTIPSLIRRPDTSRKEAREKRKARKEEELAKKREEVNRLKALKMKEVRRKLEVISKEGGLRGVEGIEELDLEGEWDAGKHDETMKGLWGDEGGEGGEEEDIEKPTWADDIDISDIIPTASTSGVPTKTKELSKKQLKKKEKRKRQKEEEGEEDGMGVDIDDMDADVTGEDYGEEEEWDGTEEMRKKKIQEYMDEVYGLDFNDMVGDLPTRFSYARVQSETYHLTPAEILLADDKDLNAYVSVKKYAPYKKGKDAWDKGRVERLKELKEKVKGRVERTWGDSDMQNQGNGERVKKKRMGKKERSKMAEVDLRESEETLGKRKRDEDGVDVVREESEKVEVEGGAKKKRKRRKKTAGANEINA